MALQLPDGAVISGWLPESKRDHYITVDLISQQEIGISRRKYDGKTEIETITTSLLSTVSLSAYGNNAVAIATKLKTVLQSSRLIEEIRAMGAGVVRFSDVRNLTATIGADYQERGQFDLVLSHSHVVTTPLERIEQVDVPIHSPLNHKTAKIRQPN